jgi:two-component system, cell cycle response regulator
MIRVTKIMGHNNLQQESAASEPALSVAIIGFEAAEEESFARFFEVSRPHQRKYAAVPTDKSQSDIIMVNYDSPAALAERDALLVEHPNIPVVAVSRGPLAEPPVYHIRGMLFAARVLTTLDKVTVEAPTEIAKEALSEPTEIQKVGYSVPTDDKTPSTQETVPAITPSVLVKPVSWPWISTTPAAVPTPAPASTQGPPAVAPATLSPTVTAKEGYRALVVDDSVAIQKSLEINLASLPQMGEIDFADSGESAIEKAGALKYDLIFLDVMMPGIDGYETCIQLRKKPEYKKTPIIMVSGKTSPLDEVKGVMAGCTTYLTKPVQQEAFQKLSIRVLTWLEKQKKQ